MSDTELEEGVIANRDTETPVPLESQQASTPKASTPTPQIEASDSPDLPPSGSPEPLLGEEDSEASETGEETVFSNPVVENKQQEDIKKVSDSNGRDVVITELQTAGDLEESIPQKR